MQTQVMRMESGKTGGLMTTLARAGWVFVPASAAFLMLLLGDAAAAEQGLNSDEIRQLKNLSRALLVTRAVSKQKMTEALQADREHIRAIHDSLAGLESVVRTEMMRTEVVNKTADSTIASASAVIPAQTAAATVRFDAATGKLELLPGASQAAPTAPGRPGQPSAEPLARPGARAAARDRSVGASERRRARVNQALDRALSEISSRRALLRSAQRKAANGQRPLAEPAVGAQGARAEGPQAANPGQWVENNLHRIEAELAALRQTGAMDVKRIAELRESVAFKTRISLRKEPEPTMQTITKHRPAQH
jgi:hypothetical protein